MFSTLSSYIWGEENEGIAQQECPPSSPSKVARDPSPDDWVLVGETAGPAPGNLAGGLPPLPGDSTPSQSSSSSSVAGDVSIEADEAVMSGPEPASIVSGRQRHPTTSVSQTAKKELRTIKSAQLVRQKNSGKALTSKALNRANKTVYSHGNKKQQFRQNLNIKMAGANKNLKQC